MLQTTPFLLFDGDCAKAMTFYHKCFGGELTLTKLADTSMKDGFPPEKHNRIINAHIKKGLSIYLPLTGWQLHNMNRY
ncbi:MAG: VOC family protein [Candidatus Micrarchaeia archaeon]